MANPSHWVRVRLAPAGLFGILGLAVLGCGKPPSLMGDTYVSPPRSRVGRYPTATVGGADFRGIDDLGEHHYANMLGEHNGIVYTCQAGHIDIAHVRKAADNTAYVADESVRKMEAGETELVFRFTSPARFLVTLQYPPDWDQWSAADKRDAAQQAAVTLGQYVSFIEATWHEIITWFGYRNVPFYPEFPSAFSWEDTFSNLLGTCLGGVALRDNEHSYDEAMTIALRSELEDLGIQSRETALKASERVRGQWYSDGFLFLIDIKKRNLDIGSGDGYITPWLVAGVPECAGAKPRRYPVPRLEELAAVGFQARLEIEPQAAKEKEVFTLLHGQDDRALQRIDPEMDFPRIMEFVRQDMIRRYGGDQTSPVLQGYGLAHGANP